MFQKLFTFCRTEIYLQDWVQNNFFYTGCDYDKEEIERK